MPGADSAGGVPGADVAVSPSECVIVSEVVVRRAATRCFADGRRNCLRCCRAHRTLTDPN